MRNRRTEFIPRHCTNTHCHKCRARIRWYRRKAWRCNQPHPLLPGAAKGKDLT